MNVLSICALSSLSIASLVLGGVPRQGAPAGAGEVPAAPAPGVARPADFEPGTGSSRTPGAPKMAQTGLSGAPQWSASGPGADFVQASVTTRTAGIVLTQTSPFSLTLPALPAGAVVLESFASWSFLSDDLTATDEIKINGVVVQGNQVGSGAMDLCWGKSGAVSYLASGITSILNLGAANTVEDACDKPIGGDPAALGEGISIVVAYELPHGPSRTVSVWAGYTSTETSPSGDADALLVLPHALGAGPAHFFLNALDGQFAADNFFLQGNLVSGLLAGTAGAGDTWIGLAGPLVNRNLYDAIDDDVGPFLPLGAVTIQASTPKIADCIAHSFAAFAMDDACGELVTYCTAKVNSQGCSPSISAAGTPSAGAVAGPFDISITELINNKPGILIYGFGAAEIPFQNGLLCIQPPVTRTPLTNTGGNPPPDDCSGVLTFDFNVRIQSGVDPALVPGATTFAQGWARDVADPVGTSLSDAICFDICP